MRVMIDTTSTEPIYRQIMGEVRRRVAAGDLRPDDALPSLRELAADLRVNPNTIVQAYRELERDGVVYVRRGHGTFVSPDLNPVLMREALLTQIVEQALSGAAQLGFEAEDLITALSAAANQKELLR